ncbi:MAG: tail fiber domain-containing protein [Chthoniobacterales bacterium]|nr:tail fiber domain-containing protein [Chthoniobacterales bacterium]
MYEQIQIGKLKPSGRNLLDWSPSRRGFVPAALALALAWIVVSPTARAVTPAPDGGYPGNNTAEGDSALFSLTTGVDNTAIGISALFSNTTGNGNTAVGSAALSSNQTGANNTAVGVAALSSNTIGSQNTATGLGALNSNTTGNQNTATGTSALLFNTIGNYNTASGWLALFSNTTGNNNTANGVSALDSNTTGSNNTASGYFALYANTTGINNAANGVSALTANTTGNYNAADGQGSLSANTTGSNNTAVGQNALKANTTGKSNIAIGSNAGLNLTTGSNNIDIFDKGVAAEANTIRLGKQGTQKTTFIAGISGATVAGGVGVIVDTNGHLGTITSSARYKDEIRPMDKASEAILALKPVTFHYKAELDPKAIPQFGLVAEQVEKVNPDLVARDDQGRPYTVRYEAVNAMLLNEFLKEHRKVEDQEATITQLKSTVVQQQKGMEILAAGLKKQESQIQAVNERLERATPLQVVDKD